MTVTDVRKDPSSLTMTITAEFDAPVDKVWELWANPRLLEKWWGPPEYPATFEQHDLTVGGRMAYYMTGPQGDQPRGWWRVTGVDAPKTIEFEDGFANADGSPNTDMPVMAIRVELAERPGGTRMSVETRFPSADAMEKIISMGMEEGMSLAMGQMDALLK